MMNKNTILGLVLSVLMLPVAAQSYKVDTSKSTLQWEGKKVTGSHRGYIQLKSGTFEIKNNKMASGVFVIDMPSMTNEDLKENKDMMNKLMGHLKSDDFFGVEKYPEAILEIKRSSEFKDGKALVTAHLTIKKHTHPVNFEVTNENGKMKASIVVDRTLYDVRYGSDKFFDNLGDKTIYDNFTLNVHIVGDRKL